MYHRTCHTRFGYVSPGANRQTEYCGYYDRSAACRLCCGREGFPLEVTPFVDRLAQENVWFNKAYTVMPASSPARCSMFTGRFPSATHVRTNHNIPDISYQQDLVGVLKENGYKTALVGKNHAYLKPADLDFWSEYGHWGKHKKTTPAEKETARS